MPRLTVTFAEPGREVFEGGIVHWLVRPGEWVKGARVIVEIALDNEIIGIPAPAAGTIIALQVADGERVYPGDELCVLSVKQLFPPILSVAGSTDPSSALMVPQLREQTVLAVRQPALEGVERSPGVVRLEEPGHMATSPVPHRHPFYQIVWLAQGMGSCLIDCEEHPLQPDMLFFFGPNRVHAFKASTTLAGLSISFTPDMLTISTERVLTLMLSCFYPENEKPLLYLEGSTAEQLIPVLNAMEQESRDQLPARAEMLQAYLYLLLTIVNRQVARQARDPRPLQLSGLVQTFIALVESEFRQKKRVSEYAALLAITPGHLNDLVRHALGKTAGEVIRERVLLEAKRMLLYTEDSIAEIADYLHFDDPSYFSRFFRRYMHQSPGMFRQTMRHKHETALPA